jgi:hypothetical protein
VLPPQQDVFRQKAADFRCEEFEPVDVLVRERVGLLVVPEKRQRQRLRSLQLVVGQRESDVDIGLLVLVADLAEELLDAARIVIGPAVVVVEVPGREPVEPIRSAPYLELGRIGSERSAGRLDRRSRILRAAFRVDRERAAERIETERGHRARKQLHARDRGARQQVPVHDVAESLVDAHAVLEHRDALRRAEQRRRRQSAEIERLLVRVALPGRRAHAVCVLLEELGERRLPLAPMSRPPKRWTLAGTFRNAMPRPGSGVMPITLHEGSSNTSAGLSAAIARVALATASATMIAPTHGARRLDRTAERAAVP